MKKVLLFLGLAICFSCVAAFSACGGDGAKEIRLDDGEIFFEYGIESSIPDASVYDKDGNAVEFDVKCEKIISPSGEEIDFTGGNFTPDEVGEYTFVLSSEIATTTVEIKLSCRDTIDPELTMNVPVEFAIKKDYDSEDYCDLEFPSFRASDLSGIRESEIKVYFGEDKREIPLSDSGTFKVTEEGALYFYVKVTDNNGRSKTAEGESFATLPERFEGYCLSSFNSQSYVTKAGEGWGNAATSRIVTVLENDTDGADNYYEGVLKVETAGMADNPNHPAYLKLTLGREIKREDIDGLTITYRIVNGGVDNAQTGYDSVWYAQNGYWEAGHSNLPLKTGENYKTISIENNKFLDQLTAFDGYIKEIRLATFGNGGTMEIYIADISYIPHDPTNLRLSVINFPGTNYKGIYFTEPFGIREAGDFKNWATVTAEGTVLFNGEEIDARLQVTEHALGDNVIYLTNMANDLGATNGDILIIKSGYGLTLNEEAKETKRDYAFVFDGEHAWTEVSADNFVFITVTGGTSNKKYCASGETVTLTVDESAIPAGKEFSHWTLNGQELGGNEFTVTENSDFVASYSDIVYTVNIVGGTADKTSAKYGETVTFTVDESAIPSGKIFYYWTVNGEEVYENSVIITGNVTVEANYGDIEVYTVNVETPGCEADVSSAVYGTTVTLSGTPAADCTLKYVVNGERIVGNSFTLTEDTTVTAINVYNTALTFADKHDINNSGLKNGIYVAGNIGLKAKGSLSNWATLSGNGTVLYNGAEITERIQVTQSELGANTIYLTNGTGALAATAGDIYTIKAGYSVIIGGIYYETAQDFNFFYCGNGNGNNVYRWCYFNEIENISLTCNGGNSSTVYFQASKDITSGINNTLEWFSNEDVRLKVRGGAYNVGTGLENAMDLRMSGENAQKFYFKDCSNAFVIGESICFEEGFAFVSDSYKLLVTDKDYTFTYMGSGIGWVSDVQELTLSVRTLQPYGNATTVYLSYNVPTNDTQTQLSSSNAIFTDKVKVNGTYVTSNSVAALWKVFKGTLSVQNIGTALNAGESIIFEAGFTISHTVNGVKTAFVLPDDVTFTYLGGNDNNSWVKE